MMRCIQYSLKHPHVALTLNIGFEILVTFPARTLYFGVHPLLTLRTMKETVIYRSNNDNGSQMALQLRRALYAALRRQNLETVRVLLRVQPSLALATDPDFDGDYSCGSWPALFWAICWDCSLDMFRLLCHGASVNHQSRQDGSTCLLLAIIYNRSEIVEYLLDHKAIDVNLSNKEGVTPLLAAILVACSVELTRLLLQNDDININASNCYGDSPLLVASHRQHIHAVQLLLEYGACTRQGSPLTVAVSVRNQKLSQLLLEYGAPVPAPALVAAIRSNQQDLLQLLLQHSANVNEQHDQRPIVWYAMWNTRLLELLWQHGADLNACGDTGESVLHRAAFRGVDETVAYLVSRNAEIQPTILSGGGDLGLDCLYTMLRHSCHHRRPMTC